MLDPKTMKDWEIAEAAEAGMKPVKQLAQELGLEDRELLPYGHYVAKLDYMSILERLKDRPDGKYVEVTAITPTPLGEGKSTTTMGLVEGLGKIGKKVIGAIRQPSGGPTFNIKGSAAGGGLAQCIPLTDFSLGLTGDIDAITNAHNLSMVALTARLQHEFNYGDAGLAKRGLKRLDIDPRNIAQGWCIDFCAQALREIIIGLGSDMDGFMMKSGFQITVSSEIMAILAVASDLKDMRERMGRIVVAYSKSGKPVTTHDLGCDGAMTALMAKAINPNLLQTIEGQPVLVHAGPFANIAIGQSSIIADRVALKLADYHVTESGFGADIGFEKFWNLKCRFSGLTPHASVLVCTVRALKMHGGGPRVAPGQGAGQGVHGEERRRWWRRAWRTSSPTSRRSSCRASSRWSASTTSTRTPTRRSPWSARPRRRPGARVAVSQALGEGRRGREGAGRGGGGRLQPEAEVQVPLRAFHAALRAHPADRHEGLRRRRRLLHARGPGEAEGHRGGRRAVEAGHLHGEDAPVPLPRPDDQGPAEGLDASHPRHPAVPGRGVHRARGGGHQADARHRLGARVPQHRRGRGHGQGEGAVLAVTTERYARGFAAVTSLRSTFLERRAMTAERILQRGFHPAQEGNLLFQRSDLVL